jgi:hypothetical protein
MEAMEVVEAVEKRVDADRLLAPSLLVMSFAGVSRAVGSSAEGGLGKGRCWYACLLVSRSDLLG